jgi:membrane protein YdbS with pleckstrin-like domain
MADPVEPEEWRRRRREDDDGEEQHAAPRPREGTFVGTASVRTRTVAAPPGIDAEELAGLKDEGDPPFGPRRALPLEDEASNFVSRYLFPTERFRGEWKRHWIHLLPPLLVGAIVTFALGYTTGVVARYDNSGVFATIAILIWLAVIIWVAWRLALWYFDRFVLTNKRVMVVDGIVARRVAMMPLMRVTDMKYVQSPLGRLFNYGTFVLESAGQEQALREIKHLPHPNELYLRVVEEMYEPQAVEARLGRTADEAPADAGA